MPTKKHIESAWASFDSATKGLTADKRALFYYGASAVMVKLFKAVQIGKQVTIDEQHVMRNRQDLSPLFGMMKSMMEEVRTFMDSLPRADTGIQDEAPNDN